MKPAKLLGIKLIVILNGISEIANIPQMNINRLHLLKRMREAEPRISWIQFYCILIDLHLIYFYISADNATNEPLDDWLNPLKIATRLIINEWTLSS